MKEKSLNTLTVQNINNTPDPSSYNCCAEKYKSQCFIHLRMFSFSIFLIGANINSNNNNLKLESRQIMTLNSSSVLIFCLIVLSIFLATKIYQCYSLITKNLPTII